MDPTSYKKIGVENRIMKEWEQELPKPNNIFDRLTNYLVKRERLNRFKKLGLISYEKLSAQTANDEDPETEETNLDQSVYSDSPEQTQDSEDLESDEALLNDEDMGW